MKRLFAFALLIVFAAHGYAQSWDRVYKMPTRQSKFLEPIGTGAVVIQQDTFRIIELTKAVKIGWKLDTVYKLGAWKAPKGSEWSSFSGVLTPFLPTDRVVAKNGFFHYPGDGDINASGSVTNADLILIGKYIAGTGTLTDIQKARADVDNDGKISQGDIMALWFKMTLGWPNLDTMRNYTAKTLYQIAPGVPQLSSRKLSIQYSTISNPNWSFDVEIGGNARIPKDDTLFFGGSTSSKHADTVVGIYKKSNGILGIFGKLGLDSYTLPSAGGSPGQVLKFPASGTLLEWGAAGSDPMTTRGDIIYHNGTAPARLAAGTLNQVLTMYNNDGHLEPHWANPTGGHTVDSIWHTAPSGAYASTSTFTGTGSAKEALMSVRSLFRCIKSDGSVLRAGYIKSASESSGTITYTVVSTSDLASGDKNFAIAYNRKVDDYGRFITIPGVVPVDASYSQGMLYTDLPDTTYLLPVNTALRTAASTAFTYNVYSGASALFSTAPDMTSNAVLREQRPTTFKLNPATNLSLRVLSNSGGTLGSDFQAKLYLIPSRLFYAY